jgi:hypothetical protein
MGSLLRPVGSGERFRAVAYFELQALYVKWIRLAIRTASPTDRVEDRRWLWSGRVG